MLFKKNKKAELTIEDIFRWMIFMLIYFAILPVVWNSREYIWDRLNITEQLIAGVLLITPLLAGIKYLLNKAKP